MTSDPASRHAPRPTPAGAAPTRRALIALLGTAPFTVDLNPSRPPAASSCTSDAAVRLWCPLQQAIGRRDQATAKRDRLEGELVARIGYPCIPVPTRPGAPLRYAAEPSTVDRLLGPARSRLRRRLKAELRDRQRRWNAAAAACGLDQAIAQEDAAFAAVQQATAALLRAPARTLPGIRLKLAVLVATGEPGPAFLTSSPWQELRTILADLDRLAV